MNGKIIQQVGDYTGNFVTGMGKNINKIGVAGAKSMHLHGSTARTVANAISGGIIGSIGGSALGSTMNIDDGFQEYAAGSFGGAGIGAVGGAGIGAIASAIAKGMK